MGKCLGLFLGLELQQVERGKHKKGIYHMQHINAFHSVLKEWMYIGFME